MTDRDLRVTSMPPMPVAVQAAATMSLAKRSRRRRFFSSGLSGPWLRRFQGYEQSRMRAVRENWALGLPLVFESPGPLDSATCRGRGAARPGRAQRAVLCVDAKNGLPPALGLCGVSGASNSTRSSSLFRRRLAPAVMAKAAAKL